MKIFHEHRKIAEITSDETGVNLTYDDGWQNSDGAFPVSTGMPLETGPYDSGKVLPWIINLLPEGPQVRTIARAVGVSQSDPLAILAKIGRDTAGAFSFSEPGITHMEIRPVASEPALERLIEEMPQKPFLAGNQGVSMALAGAQKKIGVHLDDDNGISIPINGAPSTWILKPDVASLPGVVYNEALCLRLAALAGLDAPEVRIGRAGARKYILIRRYDRYLQGNQWHRLHQEDMCQALGRLPEVKYQYNDTGQHGPTIRDMTSVMQGYQSSKGIVSLFDHVIFNTIICNTDAHAKNYSIMIAANGIRPAPVYDVMCAKLWSNVTRKQAMSLATKRYGDYFKGRHWQREAALNGFDPDLTLERVKTLCRAVMNMLPQAVEDIIVLDADARHTVEEVEKYITERAGFLLNGLAEQDPNAVAWACKRLQAETESRAGFIPESTNESTNESTHESTHEFISGSTPDPMPGSTPDPMPGPTPGSTSVPSP